MKRHGCLLGMETENSMGRVYQMLSTVKAAVLYSAASAAPAAAEQPPPGGGRSKGSSSYTCSGKQ